MSWQGGRENRPLVLEVSMHMKDNGKISAYIVRGEILNGLIGNPYAGNVIYIDVDGKTSLGKHSMKSIIKGLKGRK